MSDSNPSKFFERLNQDRELARTYQTAVAEAVRASVWPVIADVAAKAGLAFSVGEFGAWLAEQQGALSDGELSDEALQGVAGGISSNFYQGVNSRGGGAAGFGVIAGGALIVGLGGDGGGSGSSSRPLSPE